jgi:hypothetical protein
MTFEVAFRSKLIKKRVIPRIEKSHFVILPHEKPTQKLLNFEKVPKRIDKNEEKSHLRKFISTWIWRRWTISCQTFSFKQIIVQLRANKWIWRDCWEFFNCPLPEWS